MKTKFKDFLEEARAPREPQKNNAVYNLKTDKKRYDKLVKEIGKPEAMLDIGSNGDAFIITKRKSAGGAPQDKASMYIVNKYGKVIEDLGSHATVKSALKFGKSKYPRIGFSTNDLTSFYNEAINPRGLLASGRVYLSKQFKGSKPTDWVLNTTDKEIKNQEGNPEVSAQFVGWIGDDQKSVKVTFDGKRQTKIISHKEQ